MSSTTLSFKLMVESRLERVYLNLRKKGLATGPVTLVAWAAACLFKIPDTLLHINVLFQDIKDLLLRVGSPYDRTAKDIRFGAFAVRERSEKRT